MFLSSYSSGLKPRFRSRHVGIAATGRPGYGTDLVAKGTHGPTRCPPVGVAMLAGTSPRRGKSRLAGPATRERLSARCGNPNVGTIESPGTYLPSQRPHGRWPCPPPRKGAR